MACWWNVIKVNGQKHYIWFIIDSKTRFVIGYHLPKSCKSKEAHALYSSINHLNKPNSIVSDRYKAYSVPKKAFFPDDKYIQVENFRDDISNNVLESFNGTFKSWYKTKRGFVTLIPPTLVLQFLFFTITLLDRTSLWITLHRLKLLVATITLIAIIFLLLLLNCFTYRIEHRTFVMVFGEPHSLCLLFYSLIFILT